MATRSGIEKAALVLHGLPAETADKVLAELGPEHGGRLRPELEKLRRLGETPDDLGEIVREFESLLRSPQAPPMTGEAPTPRQLAAYRPSSDPELSLPDDEPALPPLPSDPVRALDVLPTDLLTKVLRGEQAHTVSLVLNCLAGEKAGEVLRGLAPEMRRDVSVRLSRLAGSPPELVARVARALVDKCRSLAGQREAGADNKPEKMANMLRCLEKAERSEVLAALDENEPDTARRIKELLYQFEDLLRIQDRSMQKLLSEVDTKSLAVALKGANEAISSKVMNNLSKRARETLTEEMEFLGMVPLAQVRQAQKELVDVIQRLDQAGELMMDE